MVVELKSLTICESQMTPEEFHIFVSLYQDFHPESLPRCSFMCSLFSTAPSNALNFFHPLNCRAHYIFFVTCLLRTSFEHEEIIFHLFLDGTFHVHFFILFFCFGFFLVLAFFIKIFHEVDWAPCIELESSFLASRLFFHSSVFPISISVRNNNCKIIHSWISFPSFFVASF